MKKIVFTIVLSTALFSLVINGNGEEQKTYISPYFNFTINYPSNWQIRELSGIVGFMSPLENKTDDFLENVNVVVENLSDKPMSLKEYEAASLMNAPNLIPSFKLLEKGKTKIDGRDAFFTIYISNEGGRSLKYKAYTFIEDSKAFTLTYTAKKENYDKYINQAEAIMKSIKIIHK